MTISSQNDLIAAIQRGQRLSFGKTSTTISSFVYHSLWKITGQDWPAGLSPGSTSGTVCTDTTTGALTLRDPTGGRELRVSNLDFMWSLTGIFYFYDRLIHSDGLSGTLTSAQPVNTPALPARAGTGEGVDLYLEIYTSTGATPQAATVSYTNSDGVSGRTGTVTIPASPLAGRLLRVNLTLGDLGVQSVQSVTLAGSTGTPGDFGVVLGKPILTVSSSTNNVPQFRDYAGTGLPQVFGDSAIWVFMLGSAASSGTMIGSLLIAEG